MYKIHIFILHPSPIFTGQMKLIPPIKKGLGITLDLRTKF